MRLPSMKTFFSPYSVFSCGFYLIPLLYCTSYRIKCLFACPDCLIVASITCEFLFSLKDASGQRNNLIKLFSPSFSHSSHSVSLCVFFIFRLCFQITSIFVMLVVSIAVIVFVCIQFHVCYLCHSFSLIHSLHIDIFDTIFIVIAFVVMIVDGQGGERDESGLEFLLGANKSGNW